jgi:hypothetical protein
MIVNTSLPLATNTPADRLASARTPAQPDGAAADAASGLDSQLNGSVATTVAQSQAGSASGQLDNNADDLSAALPDITNPAEAHDSVAAAINGILNHSSLALLAQGGHSPQTVLALLAQ